MAERIGVLYAEIDGDFTPLRRKLRQSDIELERWSKTAEAVAKLGLNDDEFDRVLKEANAKLARAEKKRTKAILRRDVIGVEVADEEVQELKRDLARLEEERVNVTVGVDRSALDRLQTALAGGILGGAAAGGLAGGGRGGPPKGLLAFLGGTGGSGKFISALGGHSLPVLTGAAIAAEGALAALAAAAVGLGAALAPLAGTLAALPGAISGLGQLGGSLFATFSGIGDAVKAQSEVTTKSVVEGTAALEQQKAAAEAVIGAKTALASAQRQATGAQEALTLARKDAARTLADMKLAAEGAALAEQGSALALRESKAELDRVLSDPGSSGIDIERAQLGIQQARQAAKEARIEAARTRRDSDRAQAGGVEKTPQVVAARRQLADANRSVTESTKALANAQESAAARTDKLSSSQQKLREEMARLSPAGRQFVRFLGSLRPAFRSIRNASQEAALPSFQRGIEGAMENLPTFRQQLTNTSRVLAGAGERFGKFVGSKGFGKDFAIIARANNNVMRNLGRALIPLTKAFNDIGVAAAPFTRWLGRAVLHLARLAAHSAKAGRASGGLARFLQRTRIVLTEFSKATGNLVHGLGGLFGAAFPQGQSFLKLLTRITGKFDDWANSTKGENSIKKFMEDQEGPLKALGEALKSVLVLIKDLAKAPGSGEGFKLFARSIKLFADALDFLARIPLLGGVIANIALLAVVAGRFGRLGPAIAGLKALAGGIMGVTAAEAAAGGGLRGFGLRIRSMLSGLAKTRVGETIAGNIAAGLGVGAIKFRKAVDGLKRMMNRILGRAGIAAGETAAGEAAGGLAASTLPGGKLGRLSERFRRLGRRLGVALGVGLVLGLAFFAPDIGKFIGDELRKVFDRIKIKTKTIGAFGKGIKIPVGIEYQTEGEEAFDKRVAEGKRRAAGKQVFAAPRPQTRLRRPIGTEDELPADRRRRLGLEDRDEATAAERRRKRARQEARELRALGGRTKTVEIQTPVLSLSAKTVEKSMNRIQRVLQRELGQARGLISRQVGRWDDVFKDFRLLRGDDPLHLGSGVRKSADEARKALRAIVSSLGNVLERLSSLARIEGREVGSQLAKGLGDNSAIRAAERLRTGVVQEFGKMKRQSGAEVQEMVANLRATFSRLPEVVSRSTGSMLKIVLTAMRALGATGRGRIVAAVDKIEGKAQGGILPGYSRTDDTLIMARSGEAILTPERHQPEVNQALSFAKYMGVGRFGSIGEMFRGTGAYQKGGEVRGYAKGGGVRGIVPIPGQPGESIHSSIVKQVVSLMRRYRGRVTDGYAPSGHAAGGEHPKGLAVDVIPGPGGSWDRIDKLASWAEPTQGSPRAPFRWVGYTGDAGHGRGNHLHLSWGGDGGSIEMTPRVRTRVKGPGGAAKELVGAAVKKVKGAANRKLRRAEGVLSASGAVGAGGPLGKPTANMKLGRQLMGRVFKGDQWPALRTLWQGESGWKTTADNPSSDAYGIPQALPGSKMRSAGKDWETNPATQIKWGLRYIKDRYGTPSKALAAWRGRSPHWYAKGGFVGGLQSFARGGRVSKALSRLPGGGRLASSLTKYDDLLSDYSTAGQQLGLATGGTVRTTFGTAPTLGTGLEEYVLKGHAIKPSSSFLKRPRSGKRKKDKKPGKGRKAKPTRVITGLVDDFSLQPFTGTFADAVMPGLLDGVDSLIDPQLEGLLENYTTAEGLADASDEEYVVTEDKLGTSVTPFIDQTAVKRRLGELDKLITIKSAVAAKMQQIVAAVEYAIQLLVSGVLRRQKAVKAIEKKAKKNQKKIDDLEDKLTKDGGGGINKAIALLNETGRLSEPDEKRVKKIWRSILGGSPPMHTSGKSKGDIKEGEALTRLREVRDSYKGQVAALRDQNVALVGPDGLKPSVIENSTSVWEPNIDTMGDHLKTYRGTGGGWLAFDPFKASADVSKLLPPATAGQITAYKPLTGSLGEALWTLERDPKAFPDGSLISERAELLQQPAGGVLDTLLKKAQASAAGDRTPAQDVQNFLVNIAELLKQFGSNFIPSIPRFAKGGVSRKPLALVGEEGPEIVRLPASSRVFSHPESLRMAKEMGIPGFARGGVIQPPVSSSPTDMREFIEQLVKALKRDEKSAQVVKNIDARSYFKEVPPAPHQYAQAVKHELESAV